MIKKLKLSPITLVALLVGVALVTVGIGVKAYSSFSDAPKVVVEGNYIEASAPVSEVGDKAFGAVASPELPNPTCQSGDCSYTVVASFADATTTIFSMPSPWLKVTSTGGSEVVVQSDVGGVNWTSATTTVDLVRIEVTGAATTSYYVACGAAPNATGVFLDVTPISIVSSTMNSRVPTSSLAYIENNLSATNGATSDGGTVSKVTVNSVNPYLVCIVSPSVAAGITNGSNTFDGRVTARFRHTR